MSCIVNESVQLVNECNYFKFVWVAGDEAGRVDYIPKSKALIQKANATQFSITDNNHMVYLDYAEISTTVPGGHTTLTELLDKMAGWACESNNASGGGGSDIPTATYTNCVSLYSYQFRYFISPAVQYNTLRIGDNSTILYSPHHNAYHLTTKLGAGEENNRCILQSKPYMNFRTDGLLRVSVAASIRSVLTVANNQAMIGYFDDLGDKDTTVDIIDAAGAFFRINPDGTMSVVRRFMLNSTQQDTVINQDSWNLDKLDGTGISGKILDPTDIQVYTIEIEINSGKIRFGFNIDGNMVYCHQMLTTNELDAGSLFNFNLPIRVEIENIGEADADSILAIYSMNADICGPVMNPKLERPYNVSVTTDCGLKLTPNSPPVSLLSIKLKNATCRGALYPTRFDIDMESKAVIKWYLIINPLFVTSVTWQDAGFSSISRYSVTNATVNLDSPTNKVIDSGIISSHTSENLTDVFKNIGVHTSIGGLNLDICSLVVAPVKGIPTIHGSLTWSEEY